jgi:hypothetical protein
VFFIITGNIFQARSSKVQRMHLWMVSTAGTKGTRNSHDGTVECCRDGEGISVVLHSSLTDVSDHLPLTLKTYVPGDWRTAEVRQSKAG